jgi:plastocyanin
VRTSATPRRALARAAAAALAGVAAAAWGALPGRAADQTITVTNPYTYAPASVTVNVGETVTWRWTNGGSPPHSVTADPGQTESFDSGLQYEGFTLTHTFSRPGRFRFHCKVHSAPGGGIQNGVVTVVDPPPTASLAASAPSVPAGGSVSFDASASADGQGPIASYQWDLDGDGTFETGTGTTPTASRAYPTPGAVTVRVRVTDGGGGTGEASTILAITGGAPIPPADTAAPRLSGFAPLRLGRQTAVRFRLSEAARLTGRLERLIPRAGRAPRVAPLRRLNRRLPPGLQRLVLGTLTPARYRLRVAVADAAGNRRPLLLGFRVR